MTLGIMKATLSGIFLIVFVTSCSFIPNEEQLVGYDGRGSTSRSAGLCTEALFQGAIHSRPGLDAEEISILNWNIYKGQRQRWDDDFQLLSYQKDFIFLQEAPLNQRLQSLLQANNLHWRMNSSFKLWGTETGVLVASRIPPLGSCGLRINEPLLRLPKTMLVNSYKIKGSAENLLVVNLHGINFSLGTGAYAEQLSALYGILKFHDGPVLLAGDFNDWSEKRKEIVLNFVQKLSLRPLSYTDKRRTTFFGDPVDHIYYRGLEPINNKVHKVTSSDHNPITATFRIKRGQHVSRLENL